MSNKGLYVVVTADRYELPVMVGTGEEVAEYCEIHLNTLYNLASRCKTNNKLGKTTGIRVYRV